MGSKRMLFLLVAFLLTLTWPLHDSRAHVRATTPSGSDVFWSHSQATLNLRLGCPTRPLTHWGPCWDDAAKDAAARWDAAGSAFTFRIQSPSRPASVACTSSQVDSLTTVVWADTNCGVAFGNSVLAVTINWGLSSGKLVDTDVLFNANQDWTTYSGPQRFGEVDFHRVALHEFGHVLGLDHPDEHGQSVNSIMNSKSGDVDRLQTDDISGVRTIYGSTDNAATGSASRGRLGIPGSSSTQSGIGVVSGWKCQATGRLTVRFDGGRAVPLVYGSERGDTRGVCGDANNGFVAIMNWSSLDDGTHTAVVYDNGVEFDRATFRVVTTGVDFLRGVTGSGTATLSNGQRATLQWSQETQSFVATAYTAPGGGTAPPTSGVGQFLGTWRFTNSHTTQTYRLPRVEVCRGDASLQCVYDDTQRVSLGAGGVVAGIHTLFSTGAVVYAVCTLCLNRPETRYADITATDLVPAVHLQ